MKLKRTSVCLLAGLTLFALASCGGSSNNESACSQIATALFTACDTSNPADQQTIITAAAGLGETLTTAQVEAYTAEAATNDCVQGLEQDGTEVTDEELAAGEAAITALEGQSCQTVAFTLLGML